MTIKRDLSNLTKTIKKFNAKLGIVLLLCTISFVAFTIPFSVNSLAQHSTMTEHRPLIQPFSKTHLSGLIPHSNITILNNAQLAAAATSGAGTLTDPYIISGYNITDNNNKFLMDIEDTYLPTIIENCYFNSEGNYSNYGISLSYEQNLTIQNNYFENMSVGITSIYSRGVIFKDNTMNLTINYAFDTTYDTNDTFDSNTIFDALYGIFVYANQYSNIINNNFNECSHDMFIVGTFNGIISNNILLRPHFYGIEVEGGGQLDVSNNTIVKAFYYGIYFYFCSNSIIKDNAVTGDVSTRYQSSGIYLYSSNFTNILGNELENSTYLLYVNTSNWNNIYNNYFGDSIGNATMIMGSSFNSISYSTFDGQSDYSLVLFNGKANKVFENNFTKSNDYDLALELENNSTVEENNFLNLGNFGRSQALDNGLNNLFIYNYWAGWTTPDSNSDGIVDNPYLIDGPTHPFDMKPLTNVNEMINISGVSNIATSFVSVTTTVTSTSNSATSTNKSSPGFTSLVLISSLLVLTGVVFLRRRKIKN